jgi:hypothetical protein
MLPSSLVVHATDGLVLMQQDVLEFQCAHERRIIGGETEPVRPAEAFVVAGSFVGHHKLADTGQHATSTDTANSLSKDGAMT